MKTREKIAWGLLALTLAAGYVAFNVHQQADEIRESQARAVASVGFAGQIDDMQEDLQGLRSEALRLWDLGANRHQWDFEQINLDLAKLDTLAILNLKMRDGRDIQPSKITYGLMALKKRLIEHADNLWRCDWGVHSTALSIPMRSEGDSLKWFVMIAEKFTHVDSLIANVQFNDTPVGLGRVVTVHKAEWDEDIEVPFLLFDYHPDGSGMGYPLPQKYLGEEDE